MVEPVRFTSYNLVRRPVALIARDAARIVINAPVEDRPYAALAQSGVFAAATVLRTVADLTTSAASLGINYLVGGLNVLDLPGSLPNLVEHPSIGLWFGTTVLALGATREILGLKRSILFGLNSAGFAAYAGVAGIANAASRRK